jgi:hypothetical protein
MQPGEIIGLCIAVGILTTLVTIGIVRWRQTHLPWVPLEGYPGVWCYFEGPPDHVGLALALSWARAALTEHTGWADVGRALEGLHVHVKSTETWGDDSGTGPCTVAGLQMDAGVRVGPSYAALCHEVAHRYQQLVGDPAYPTHEGWAERGIYRAIDLFGALRGA